MATLQELYPWLPVNTLPQEPINQLEAVANLPISPPANSVNPVTDYQYTLNNYYFDLNTNTLGLSGTTPTGTPVQVPLTQNAQDVILGANTLSDPLSSYLTDLGVQLNNASLPKQTQGGIDIMMLLLILAMAE